MEGEEVNFDNLKPDQEYIVYQPYLVNDSRSGKKIGRFKKLKDDPYGDMENADYGNYSLTYEVADFYDLKEFAWICFTIWYGFVNRNRIS